MPTNNFRFNVSLSVLNHLGRNLYRSFATVLGEAVSNSWDADARNVRIYLNREKDFLCIKDDGDGMTSADFQDKFLKIGYSKRGGNGNKSAGGRSYIGRKGIGKLALLSCARKISVKSKVLGGQYIGGTIDNASLDKAIKDDASSHDYVLGIYDDTLFKPFDTDHAKGTIIYFEGIKNDIHNTDDFLKKIIALYFRFSLIDSTFNVYLNDDLITLESLKALAEKTQFIWDINDFTDPFLDLCSNVKEIIHIKMSDGVRGFIASVESPRHRNIHSSRERVAVDLFVNGRLRETDILKHLPSVKARVPESYLYGQIHLNSLDAGNEDPFTSSREGVKMDSEEYKKFLEELRIVVTNIVENQWDILREKYEEDGDPENTRKSKKQRRAEELASAVFNEYLPPKGSEQYEKVESWSKELRQDASFNFESYADCFVSENLLRKHIEKEDKIPTSCTNTDPNGKTCLDRYNPKNDITGLCEYCRGQSGKDALQLQKAEVKTAIPIRTDEDNILMYLDYTDLARIIGDGILTKEVSYYKPLRNSVMHTSLLTSQAKTKLTSIFDNILAAVKKLMEENDS